MDLQIFSHILRIPGLRVGTNVDPLKCTLNERKLENAREEWPFHP